MTTIGDLFSTMHSDPPPAPQTSAAVSCRSAHVARHVVLDGRQVDTASHEWMLICLARHVCRMPTLLERQAFFEKLKWERSAVSELRRLVKQEWQRMYPNGRNGQGCGE